MKAKHAMLPHWQEKDIEQKIDALHDLIFDLYQYTMTGNIEKINNLLMLYRPSDNKEENDIKLIRDLLKEHPNLLNMNCEIGHITGSALVIDEKGNRFLLHRHKTLRNKWLQFGGHPEYETDISLVALREATEESGLKDLIFYPDATKHTLIDVDVHTIPPSKGRPEHLHLDLRFILATNSPDDISPEEEESNDFMWVSFDDLEGYKEKIDYPLYRLIHKASKLMLSPKS